MFYIFQVDSGVGTKLPKLREDNQLCLKYADFILSDRAHYEWCMYEASYILYLFIITYLLISLRTWVMTSVT